MPPGVAPHTVSGSTRGHETNRGSSLGYGRPFLTFLAVQTLSATGSSFSLIAIPLLVLHTTGSVLQMGLITGLGGAASLIMGVFAGFIADRVNRRALLIGSDVARFVLHASIPVAWLFAPQLWLLYVAVPLSAACGMLARVTQVTVVPGLVPKDQIIKANGHLFASTATAYLAGPALAGLVSGSLGPQTAIAVDAASFALSAIGLAFIKLPRLEREPSTQSKTAQFLAGAKFLWHQPVLRSLTILLAVFTSITMGLTDVFIFRLKHDLAQPDRVIGFVMAASFAGTLVASLGVARIRHRFTFGTTWIGACVLCGLSVLGMAWSTSAAMIWLMAAGMALATGIAGISSMSLRQEITPSELLGRVTSAFWTLHGALNPLGIALLAAAAGKYGTTATLFVSGAACVLIALSALLTPVYSHQREPQKALGET